MKQCENGHIYDEKTYAACPYCNQAGLSVVRPLEGSNDLAFPKTSPIDTSSAPEFPKTAPLDAGSVPAAPQAPARPKKEMSATVALNVSDAGIAPVCGWLVVTEGENKGLSFPVHSEKNTIKAS